MTTDAEHGQAAQTKALEAIAKDVHIIRTGVSVLVLLAILGTVLWLLAVFAA